MGSPISKCRVQHLQNFLQGLTQAILMKGHLAIQIRSEGLSSPLPFPKHQRDRPLDAGVVNHPRLAVFREPGPPISECLSLYIDLAAVGVDIDQVVESPRRSPKKIPACGFAPPWGLTRGRPIVADRAVVRRARGHDRHPGVDEPGPLDTWGAKPACVPP
jgi:hypothetical protein